MLDAKKYLSQVKWMEKSIQQMKEKLLYHQEAACSIRTSRINPNGRIQTNSMHNSMEDHLLNAYDLEIEIAQKQLELEMIRNTIINQIHCMSNYRHIEVLYYCFVLNLKQSDIAKKMDCSIDYVKELKKKAMKEFESIVTG